MVAMVVMLMVSILSRIHAITMDSNMRHIMAIRINIGALWRTLRARSIETSILLE